MKDKVFGKIVSVILFIGIIIMTFCLGIYYSNLKNSEDTAKENGKEFIILNLVKRNNMVIDNDYWNGEYKPLKTYTNTDKITQIKNLLAKKEEQPGMYDMAGPHYIMAFSDAETVQLWIFEESISIMYRKEPSTLYKLDKDDATSFQELLDIKSKKIDCEFTRTFKVKEVEKVFDFDNDNLLNFEATSHENSFAVRLRGDFGDFKANTSYEFVFRLTNDIYLETNVELFDYSEVVSVTKTDKAEEEQVNEPVCSE